MERYSSKQRRKSKKNSMVSNAEQANTFSQILQTQYSTASDPAVIAPPQKTVAAAPQSNNELTAYESQLKVLEKKLVPGSMAPPTIGHSNSNAYSNVHLPQANLD